MAAPEIEAFRGRLLRDLDRIIRALDGLDEEAVNWKPKSPSANSLLVLATHALGAAEEHVVRQVAGKPIARSRDSEFAATGAATLVGPRAEEVKRRITDALNGFDPTRLGEARESPFGERTVRDWLVHAVAHASEHAGQAELTRDLWRARTSG